MPLKTVRLSSALKHLQALMVSARGALGYSRASNHRLPETVKKSIKLTNNLTELLKNNIRKNI